ncbi:hypothetical protein CDD83_1699 [Cordyceps sp. RAO-2017]|nr:hypothetical protein CDD83_1699 [Cordyceps sp. RAO-2017]
MTRPSRRPTLRTRLQSLPSTRTVAQRSGPSRRKRALGCSSTGPSSWAGSSSGFSRPDQRLQTSVVSVARRRRRPPCMLALSSSLGEARAPEAAGAEARASLVKRSEMALSCSSGGSWMWTSGSRTLGCMIISTVSGCRTRTGMSCVMILSCSRRSDVSTTCSGRSTSSSSSAGARAAGPDAAVVVVMVMDSIGSPSFFVSRSDAEMLLSADRSARCSGCSGSSRLIVLPASADWMW